MARYQEFTIDQGTDVTIQFNVAKPNGDSKDLTDYTVESKMKKSYNSDSDNTYSFQATVANAASGLVELSLTNTQSDLIKAGTYLYDVELTHDSDGTTLVERILEGKIFVTPSVTR
jgi:hypothetical protein